MINTIKSFLENTNNNKITDVEHNDLSYTLDNETRGKRLSALSQPTYFNQLARDWNRKENHILVAVVKFVIFIDFIFQSRLRT